MEENNDQLEAGSIRFLENQELEKSKEKKQEKEEKENGFSNSHT
jgi:hypothetical protein